MNVSLRFNKGPDIRDSRPAGNRMGQDNQKTAAFRLKQPKRPFQHEIVRTLLWPASAQFVSLQCTGFLIRKVKRRIHQNDIESRQLSAFDISEINSPALRVHKNVIPDGVTGIDSFVSVAMQHQVYAAQGGETIVNIHAP